MPTEQNAEILKAMKESVAALRDNDIDFALAGGLAAWARGGPATEHDVDLVIREADVERALVALRKAGMHTDIPPEGWLAKAWHEGTLIDLIHSPMEVDIDDAFFARCDVMSVAAVM